MGVLACCRMNTCDTRQYISNVGTYIGNSIPLFNKSNILFPNKCVPITYT